MAKRQRRGYGEGSIYQRDDGLWAAQVNLGVIAGKRRRRTISGRTRKEVQEKLREVLREVERGATMPNNESLEEFLTRWLELIAKKVRPKTLESYSLVVRAYIVPEIGGIKLAKLKPQDVQGMLQRLEKRELSTRTVRYALQVLSQALTVAEKWALIARNVAQLAEPPKITVKQQSALSPEQLHLLIEQASGTRYALAVALGGILGLRRGEVLGLQWRDVDEAAGTISIRRAVIDLDAGEQVGELKTSSSRRVVPIPDVLRPILVSHKMLMEAQHGALSADAFVLQSETGGYVAPRNLYRAWSALLKRAQLPHAPFHALRHTAATLMAEAGVPPHVARDILGHSDIATTMEIYTHVLDGAKEAAGVALDRLMNTAERQKAAKRAAERENEER